MQIQMLKSKLHQACITQANIDYEGSLTVDTELLDAVGIHPYEKVLVANINNAQRFETYAIPAPVGTREVILNGAAARLGTIGDRIIIMCFAWVEESVVRSGKFRPRVLRLNENNEPVTPLYAVPTTAEIAAMIEG